MQQDIVMVSNDVVTAVAVYSFLRKNIDVHVAMSGLGQRQRTVKIRSNLKDIDKYLRENWKKIGKANMQSMWVVTYDR